MGVSTWMKQEEKWCVILGIGAAIVVFAATYWYISLPILCLYLYLRHRKKHPKKKKVKETKSPYPVPRTKYYKTNESQKVIAKTRYKPRNCPYCKSEVRYLSTVHCPYCGGSL